VSDTVPPEGWTWRVSLVRQATGQEWSGYGSTLPVALDNLSRLAAERETETAHDAQIVRAALADARQA